MRAYRAILEAERFRPYIRLSMVLRTFKNERQLLLDTLTTRT